MPTVRDMGVDDHDGAKLRKVEDAISMFHSSLDRRLNADLAAHQALKEIETALGMHWMAKGSD